MERGSPFVGFRLEASDLKLSTWKCFRHFRWAYFTVFFQIFSIAQSEAGQDLFGSTWLSSWDHAARSRECNLIDSIALALTSCRVACKKSKRSKVLSLVTLVLFGTPASLLEVCVCSKIIYKLVCEVEKRLRNGANRNKRRNGCFSVTNTILFSSVERFFECPRWHRSGAMLTGWMLAGGTVRWRMLAGWMPADECRRMNAGGWMLAAKMLTSGMVGILTGGMIGGWSAKCGMIGKISTE